MKILLVTNKVKTYANGFRNVIEPLTGLGHQVIWAADFSGFAEDVNGIPCKTVQIPIQSNPLKPSNRKALKLLRQTIRDEKIEAVHCSTPIGGMLARLAAKKENVPTVIYAAHGFLFFKGAPLLGRTIYKWQEQWQAHHTDVLITITEEDRCAGEKFKLRSGRKPYLVHGAGVEAGRTVSVDKEEKRRALGVPENAFIMLSAGFLNPNKNNRILLDAIGALADKNIYYLICGEGAEKTTLEKQAEKLGISERVRFLGYRTDLPEIMAVSDLFAMPSFREGVPRALLEAMDLGVPCIGSDTRGIRELLPREALCDPRDAGSFRNAIRRIKNGMATDMRRINRETVKKYSNEQVREELLAIYKEIL